VYIVVSSATTGFFEFRASRTSSDTRKKPLFVRWRLPAAVATPEHRKAVRGLAGDLASSLMLTRESADWEVWREGWAQATGRETAYVYIVRVVLFRQATSRVATLGVMCSE
jgi:hypothetical protein